MDWWSLGLLMHEMLASKHPFHGPSHYETLRNMVTKPPTIDIRLSPNAKTLVKSFLVKKPAQRLCCKSVNNGVGELKSMSFFKKFDWASLEDGSFVHKPGPYVPPLHDITDTSSFESTFTNEIPVDSVTRPTSAGKPKVTADGGGGMFSSVFSYLGLTSTKPASNQNSGDGAGPQSDGFDGFAFERDDVPTSPKPGGSPRRELHSPKGPRAKP
jgi:hypothetical protein